MLTLVTTVLVITWRKQLRMAIAIVQEARGLTTLLPYYLTTLLLPYYRTTTLPGLSLLLSLPLSLPLTLSLTLTLTLT